MMNQTSKQVYEFGSFRLDAAERLLFCDGEVVPLALKASLICAWPEVCILHSNQR